MTTRRFTTLLLALGACLMLAMVAPSQATAQIGCFCTILVENDVNCSIDVCYVQPGQPRKCFTLSSTLGAAFQCVPGTRFYFKVCGNEYIEVTTAACENNWSVPGGCCVNACLTQNANGCYSFRISKSNSPICKCLPDMK